MARSTRLYGAKAVTIGGASALPYLAFEGTFPNKPAVALEVTDIAPDDWPETVKKAVSGAASNPVQWAKFCQQNGADVVALRLIGTHPDQQNKSAEEAAKIGFTNLAWPKQYVSGKPQMEANYVREKAQR